MRTIFVLSLFLLCACTTVYYPNGNKAISVSSNAKIKLHTPDFDLEAEINNAIIIQKVGAAVSQGIMATASRVATGVVLP